MSTEVLKQITAQKQDLLNKAFLSLLGFENYKKLYREKGEGNFNLFCLYCYKKLEQMEESAPMMRGEMISQQLQQLVSPKALEQEVKKSATIVIPMLSVNYRPPLFDDIDSLIRHLYDMWHLYECEDMLSAIDNKCLDLSFAKLLSAAHRRIVGDLIKAEREEPRKAKGIKEKKLKKAESYERIYKTYHAMAFPIGVSLHKIATEINTRENISLDTIKRALRANSEIWQQFKEIEIRGKKCFIKQT